MTSKLTLSLAALSLTALAACEMPVATDNDFDAAGARLDLTLDTDGDGNVTDDEIIEGNMARFDTNGDGVIDVTERQQAEEEIRVN